MREGNCIMTALIQVARNASPYLAIELLLPGGSIIALLLWLFRHRFKKEAGPLGIPGIGPRSWKWIAELRESLHDFYGQRGGNRL
jgi:hypothetical protein